MNPLKPFHEPLNPTVETMGYGKITMRLLNYIFMRMAIMRYPII